MLTETAATSPGVADDETVGQQAAEAIFHHGLKAPYEERRTTVFARAAVARLAELFGRTGLVRDMVQGAKQGAEALNVEAFHGIVEVVQNAEDQRATEVRIGIAKDVWSAPWAHKLSYIWRPPVCPLSAF